MGKKCVEMAPVLQNMQEYISHHFMDELLEEVNAGIANDLVDGLDIDKKDGEYVFDNNDAKIVRSTFWLAGRTELLADIRMKLRIGVAKEGFIPHYYVRYVNFTMKLTMDGGIILHPGLQNLSTNVPPEHNLPKLSKYLVPVLSYDEMEVLVMEMLRRYLGETAATSYQEGGASMLAEAMGLKLMDVSLYRNHHTAAILYLKEGHARVTASGASGTGVDEEAFRDIIVPAKTILINNNRERQGDFDREVYHECGHYEWHSMFFELQNLHSADLRLLEYGEADKASKPAIKDIHWVERQANFVSLAAMFPRPVITPMLNQYWGEVANSRVNLGQKFSTIIGRIASEKLKPKSLVKARLLTLGCTGAKGAYNYVDGAYIQPFAFNPDSLYGNETFVISRAQFTEMYEKDKDFRQLIGTYQFVYADGHVCCNHPQFVQQGDKGFTLTRWAAAHVDECCLKFHKTYRTPGAGSYQVGELHSDQEYNAEYLMIHSLEVAGGMKLEELMERNAEYLEDFPTRPTKVLAKLIQDRVGSQSKLALNSGISQATISRMCKDDNFRYSVQQVTRLVVGLRLPPPLSGLLLESIGFTRTIMARHHRYQCIIDCMFMDDIYQIVDTHKDMFDE